MARVRMTMQEAAASNDVDGAKVGATTDEDIRGYMIEDGEDPDAPAGAHVVVLPVAAVRKRTGLSQQGFARAIGVPLATLRNWEQGRTLPDPAARSLLTLVAADPERALQVLRPTAAVARE